MEQIKDLELKRAKKLAEEYHKQGYEVLFRPDSEKLPDFLRPFRPDILVFKDEIKKVIAVKSRASLSDNPQIRELARLIQGRKGWEFEIVIVRIGEDIYLSEETEPYSEEDITYKIEDAKKFMNSSHFEAAFLYVWSANEAALRLVSERENIDIKINNPLYIIKNLTTEGIISKNDYDMLMSARKIRNAIVHGYKPLGFKADIIYRLIHFIEDIMKQSEELLTA
ncbi:MAG: hypothetical protein DRI57_11455 [Deltaproteobacteria bacterium]|nr:MAG: hypothetical protein DRI57_11455 [Deltaproteobacteria bacterium]